MKAPAWLINIFRLSKKEYFLDFVLTPPITILYAIYSITHHLSMWSAPAFLTGLFAWTFYEYIFHRFGLHKTPIMSDVHELHHKNQKDYIAFPPWMTLAQYVGFYLVFGVRSSFLMVGFTTGYVLYASLHTAFHYAQIKKGSILYNLKQAHVLHHRYHDVNFGVTSTVWDKLFKTYK